MRQNEKETGSGGTIDEHVEDSAEFCGLAESACGVTIDSVENKTGSVEEEAECGIVEGDGIRPKSYDDAEITNDVWNKKPNLPRLEGGHFFFFFK